MSISSRARLPTANIEKHLTPRRSAAMATAETFSEASVRVTSAVEAAIVTAGPVSLVAGEDPL